MFVFALKLVVLADLNSLHVSLCFSASLSPSCLLTVRLSSSLTETMAVDSMLPSPSSLSSPMLGIEGLPGRRRKKRTSIETNVRVALERNFCTVRRQPVKKIHGDFICIIFFYDVRSMNNKKSSRPGLSSFSSSSPV